MSNSIVELVNELPQGGLTVRVLKALDFVAPGTWYPAEDFDSFIQSVTGVSDRATRDHIRDRAVALYNDKDQPYAFCTRLYRTIDKTDGAIGAAAMANKVGEKIKLLSLLNKLTPKADTLQAFDLVMKIAVELVVFCKLNRVTPDPRTFANAVASDYSGPALARMATLVCIDGLLPLGPEFINKVEGILNGASTSEAANNQAFKAVSGFIPGGGDSDKLSFVKAGFGSITGWMQGLVERTNLNPSTILSRVGSFIDAADGKMDFVAAFLDQTTNYFEYTGIQTVAIRVIQDAYEDVKANPPAVAAAPNTTPPADIPPERIGPNGEFNQSGLAQRVLLAFKSDAQLSGTSSIYAAQAGTKVVLKGQVASGSLRDRAVQIAQAQQGCTEVDASQLAAG